MRLEDIKFKAKRLDNGEWVVGALINPYLISKYVTIMSFDKGISVCIDPSTVCQYTGMKDCNGQEIWEHDLFQTGKHKSEVHWNEELACFCTQPDFEEVKGITPLGSVLRIWRKATVIGNRFDKEEGK